MYLLGNVLPEYDKEKHRKHLGQVHRLASDYGTVSEALVMVITGVVLLALLAKKRKANYTHKGENLRVMVAHEERQRTITEWQLSW